MARAATTLVVLHLSLATSLARAAPSPPLPASSGSAPASPPPPAPSSAKPLDTLRERFREGMDKYKAGAFADAIVIWESIYRELGADKGYRLAFDLARAYDELGEQIKAAEHFETYLDRVAARRREGEQLEPVVAKQETDARERLEKIAASKSRIHVSAAEYTVIVQVDNSPPRVAGFTTYLEPGEHVVTFGPGSATADTRALTLQPGELLDVAPPPRPVTPPPASPPQFETRNERPFSPTIVWIGVGVAVASIVVPVVTYANALSIKSDYDAPSATASDKTRLSSDYATARSNAYASVLVPGVLAAGATVIALWYVLGTKEIRVPITPSVGASATGASVGATARF